MPDATTLDTSSLATNSLTPAAAAHDDAHAASAMDEVGLMAPVYPLPRIELVSGRGAWVTDREGNRYLDFVSGIAVNALGHAAPAVARAVAKQARVLGQVSNLFANRPAAALAHELAEATGYPRVFFCNSGTEAVEAALKFSRARARHKGLAGRDVVGFRGGFHGRTAFSLSATWTPSYREPFEPLMPGIRFGDLNQLEGLDTLIDEHVAAVIVEPVQGEAGAIPATAQFLRALRARSEAVGAALIFDEVQSGMGRCGTLLAQQQSGVSGDFTVLSKALGGGLPLGAVLMTTEAAEALAPGMHGCTFGGGPIAASAGLVVLERVRDAAFQARVRSRGRRLLTGLKRFARAHASVAEARGLGLLLALDLAKDATFDAASLVRACRDRGLLLVRGGERALRLLPPLVVTPAEIDQALERLDAALTSFETLTPQKEQSS